MMRKTGIDIPGYIAEGCGKSTDEEFAKSLRVALGFANRLEYYALMASDLGFFADEAYELYSRSIVETKKMINGFNRRLG